MEAIHYRELPSNPEGLIIKTLYLEAELQGRGLTLKEFEGLGHDKAAVRMFVKHGFLQEASHVRVVATGQHLRVHRFNIQPLRWYEKQYWIHVKLWRNRRQRMRTLWRK